MDSITTESTTAEHDAMLNDAALQRVVTLREAAELCGTSINAIRGRVERGSLQHVKRDGKRLVPVSELQRVGLMAVGASSGIVRGSDPAPLSASELLLRLLDAEHRVASLQTRLELEQGAINERLRVEREAAQAMELELVEARATITALEQQLQSAQAPRKRWFGLSRKS